MSEICSTCGLPKELCVCETIAKETQNIVISIEKKKFGKLMTIVKGIDNKQIDIKEVSKKLKSAFACGGTVKNGVAEGGKTEKWVELQGDHQQGVKAALVRMGFPAETIQIKAYTGKRRR